MVVTEAVAAQVGVGVPRVGRLTASSSSSVRSSMKQHCSELEVSSCYRTRVIFVSKVTYVIPKKMRRDLLNKGVAAIHH